MNLNSGTISTGRTGNGIKYTFYIRFSNGSKFKTSYKTGDKIQEILKPYFGCAWSQDILSYDIPDKEVDRVENNIYQMFGEELEFVKPE